MPPDVQQHSALLRALAAAAAKHPTADKLIVCQPRGVGRELLHALARAGYPWLGFRVQTPRDLAKELAAPRLAAAGLTPVDGFEELALLDEAIDMVLATRTGTVLADLGHTVGFRNALATTIRDLRLAGLDAESIAAGRIEDRAKGRALAAIQLRYEERLREHHGVDLAAMLGHAVDAVEHGAELSADHVYLMPGIALRGLRGALLEALLRRGAVVLAGDPVEGIEAPDALLEPAVAGGPVGTLSYLYDPAALPQPDAPPDLLTPELAPVDVDLFAAASPADEIREVLRRVMAAGVPFDDVEIIATDRVVYGTSLDSIAPRLVHHGDHAGRVTHAAGLPVARTRVGRAVNGYLRWIGEGFPDDLLRSMLQAGLLTTADGEHELSGAKAARLLRGLRIGWGRERYLRQIDWALEALDEPPATRDRRHVSDDERSERRDRRRRDLHALRGLLAPLLDATPETPDRVGADAVPVSPAALAEGVGAFLAHVPTPDEPDTEHEAKRRLREVLARAAATLTRDTDFGSAATILARFLDLRVPSPSTHGRIPWSSAGGYLHFADVEHGGLSGRPRTFVIGLDAGRFPGLGTQDALLLDLRVPSPSTHGRVPWSSAGGYLHFADVEHGGLSGRPHTFVIGLDAGRFPGLGTQDALLLDSDKGRLSEALPMSADLLAERRYQLASLLARLRGNVTFSYSAWDASEGRNLSPSPLLLQVLRLRDRNPVASYEELHAATRPIRGPVPASGDCVDNVDLWLRALDDDGVLRPGVDSVRAEFAGLDAGLEARELRLSRALNAHKGIVTARPEHFDPRRRGRDLLLSASRLETLAGCPLRYFFGYVLRLRTPRDVAFESDRWLDPLQRGSMFHDVYERVIREAIDRRLSAPSEELSAAARTAFDDEIRRARFAVPVPSEAVYEREVRELRADLDVFLGMLAAEPAGWLAPEWSFGFDDADHDAIELPVGGGTVFLRGAVDRVDALDSGKLAIVDYKTGSVWGYGEATGTYNGGTRLQHALYTQAVERGIGREVAQAAYHFPTRKGRGDRAPYPRARLDRWDRILEQLFDMVGAGWFPAPFDDNPPCKICDFQALCRVREDNFGNVTSPPVEWAKENNALKPEYAPLQRIRKIDGEESA